MNDISTPILTTLLSGFVFSRTIKITFIRLVVYLLLIGIFLIPRFVKMNDMAYFFFSFSVAAFVCIIKLFLYLLNKLVDKSIELLSSSSDHGEPLIDDTRPPNIPGPLWDRRGDYLNGRGLTDDDVLNLITSGFYPDAVFEFHRIIQRGEYNNVPISSVSHSSLPDAHNYLNICGHLFVLPFQRKTINSIFPGNDSIFYIIIITLLAFVMTFLTKDSCPAFVIYGMTIYSFLHPPETDPYSTTRGDLFTGTSRAFFVSVILVVHKILDQLSKRYMLIHFNYFNLTIDWIWIKQEIDPILDYSIYLMPFVILFYVGHPLTIITWFFEWVSRYAFGLGGSIGIVHSLIQFIRSSIVASIVYFILNASKGSKGIICVCFGIASLLLQIPLSGSTNLKKNISKFIISIIILSAVSILFAFVGTFLNYNISSYIVCSFSILFDVIWPYMISNNNYFIFYLRFFGKTSKTVNTIRLMTSSAFAPFLFSSFIFHDNENIIKTGKTEVPFLFISILLVCIINRSLVEPHIFGTSILIFISLNKFELSNLSPCFLLFLSFIISRKLSSILPIASFYRFCRPRATPLYFYDNTTFIENFIPTMIISFIPGPDRSIGFPAFVWSIITGAPFNSPGLVFLYFFPSSPRPNSFWETLNNGQNLDPKFSFSSRLTEHPIETPVYTSATRSLSLSLSPLLKSGRLGIVDSNDVFLFMNDTLAAFVHIVANEAHCVRFQLRGLEYHHETSCHRGELEILRKSVEEYQFFPNFTESINFRTTNWEIRAISVPLRMYSASSIEISGALLGVGQRDIIHWVATAFAFIVKKNERFVCSELLPEELVNNNNDNQINDIINEYISNPFICEVFVEKLRLFGGIQEEEVRKRAIMLFAMLKEAIFMNNSNSQLNYQKLAELFNEEVQISAQFAPQENELKYIVFPATRLATLLLQMAANGIAPEINNLSDDCNVNHNNDINNNNNNSNSDNINNSNNINNNDNINNINTGNYIGGLNGLSEIVDFLEEIERTYLAAPITSEEFSKEFQEEIKDIFTIITKEGQIRILNFKLTTNDWDVFAIQREYVRSFWASEANSQLFLGESSSERKSIQMNEHHLHNLIVQSCNIPLGYPALVSPILSSYSVPPSFQLF